MVKHYMKKDNNSNNLNLEGIYILLKGKSKSHVVALRLLSRTRNFYVNQRKLD
jgi:hypothetical protein